MSFIPKPNDKITINGIEYNIDGYKDAPDFTWMRDGAKASVYHLTSPAGIAHALKVFMKDYREPRTAITAENLLPLSSIKGLESCARTVIIPEDHFFELSKYPLLIHQQIEYLSGSEIPPQLHHLHEEYLHHYLPYWDAHKPAEFHSYISKERDLGHLEGLAIEFHNNDLLKTHIDLRYAVLMRWVDGMEWKVVINNKKQINQDMAFTLAKNLAEILSTFELPTNCIAHTDISSGNVIVSLKTKRIHLIDVEDIYRPGFPEPTSKSFGTPGYQHKIFADGYWGPLADRFSGAVMIMEMLAWFDEGIRKLSAGDSFFEDGETQQHSIKYEHLLSVVEKAYPRKGLGKLFEKVWFSNTLEECPTMAEWKTALEKEEREDPRNPSRQLIVDTIWRKVVGKKLIDPIEPSIYSNEMITSTTIEEYKHLVSRLISSAKENQDLRSRDEIICNLKTIIDPYFFEVVKTLVPLLLDRINEPTTTTSNSQSPNNYERIKNSIEDLGYILALPVSSDLREDIDQMMLSRLHVAASNTFLDDPDDVIFLHGNNSGIWDEFR